MAGCVRRKIPCLRPKIEEDVRVLDYRHSSLQDVPSDVFNKERTLEELYIDCNQIRDLPRELFFCHGLRKLSISDNEITSIPPAISSFANLEELDFSKNGIIDVPESIKGCKYLRSIDASVNPLGKLPEGFTHLSNLTHLYLNDTFLDFLPGSFGRMVTLKILELRENHLKTLPRSFSRLVELQRLDIGNNELTELSDVIGGLCNLLELWCDNNQIKSIAANIGNLKQLMFLDVSNNHLQELPVEIDGCTSLADLHLTGNSMMELPHSIGNLENLTTLKVDDNQLTSLPKTLGGLSSLSELNVSGNDLEDLPASIGFLRNLRTFYADENLLQFIPSELGSCSGITVLSLRCNKLTYIPDELGRIPRLRVLNLSDNLLSYLPFSIIKLKELQALWLAENQTRPLIPLQSEYDAETGRKILTCYLLPQGQMGKNDERDNMGDNESFHASMWDEERLRRQQIHFASADFTEEGTLVRCPTPYPKEMREKVRHARNLALRQMISVGDSGSKSDLVAEGGSHILDHSPQISGAFAEKFGYQVMPENADLRVREAWITKPTSPKFQEIHRLHKYDKDKLQKDKARIKQHRLSMPDFDNVNAVPKEGRNKDKKGHESLSRHSGSVPDLASDGGKDVTSTATELTKTSAPVFSMYDDLYYKQIVYRHKGRRSRRMREYDSDTGYRSDGEHFRFPHESRAKSSQGGTSSEIMSVQSQPVPHRYHHLQLQHSGRDGLGYTSDIETSMAGSLFPTANAAAAAFQKKPQILGQQAAQSMPYNLDMAARLHADYSTSFRNSPQFSPSKSEASHYSQRPGSEYLSYHRRTANASFNRFTGNASPNYNRNSGFREGNTNNSLPNDQLYKHSPSKDYTSSSQVKFNSASDVAGMKHHGLSQSQKETPSSGATNSSLQTQSNSRQVSHGSMNQSSKLATSEPLYSSNLSHASSPVPYSTHSVNSTGEGSLSIKQNLNYSLTQSQLAFHKDNYISQNPSSSTQPQIPPTAEPNSSHNYATFSVHRGEGRHFTVLEDRSATHKLQPGHLTLSGHLTPSGHVTPSGHLTPSGHPTTTPPPYNPAPQYRRPDNVSPRQHADRPSSVSSSGRTDISRGTSRHGSVLGASTTGGLSSGISALNLNLSQSSPCGFHGGSTYPDLPTMPRDKPDFSDYAEIDHKYRSNFHDSSISKSSPGSYKDTQTSRSGSNSSHIGSASQTGALNPHRTGMRIHDRSDSSDSRSDIHNHSLSRESPHSGSVYESARTSTKQDRLYDHYYSPFDIRNYEDIAAVCTQEQSSQVSSSTDSGYGPGHQVYERLGDHSKAGSNSYSSQGDQRTQGSGMATALFLQKQLPVDMSDNVLLKDPVMKTFAVSRSRNATPVKDFSVVLPDSSVQEHTDQFQVTIHKNPGLGFSVAGGIGSHGNPYRENDIGIFVTKVSPDSPASKILRPGDKILQVNGIDFTAIEHNQAVSVLKNNSSVDLLVERIQKVNMV